MKNDILRCIFYFILLLYISCDRNVNKEKLIICNTDSVLEFLPDSSFFSDIRSMQCVNDKIFFLDVERRDIVELDEGFNHFKTYGKPGAGPEELDLPVNFFVNRDTIYIMDLGAKGVKCFVSNTLSELIHTPKAIEQHFFLKSNHLYIPYITDTSSILIVPHISDDITQKDYVYGGKITKFDSKKQTIIRNHKHLFTYKNYLYAVSDNLPVIEKYDIHTMKLMESYDLSDVSIVKRNLSYISSQESVNNSYYVFFEDAGIIENQLYILCAELGKKYRVNTIIKIDMDSFEKSLLYKLPGNYYRSFCVSENYIFAFNKGDSRIERIRL